MLRSLAILLLLTAQTWAGWSDRRIVKLADGGSGSFVRIGECVMILSCAHRTATVSVAVGERVGYQCGDDSQGTATVVAVYPHDPSSTPFRDAAIYSIDRQPPNIQPFTITGRETPANAKVWVVGFPMPVLAFCSRITRTLGYDGALWLEGSSTPGESGGPIVNEQGEIVGTLTGTTSDGRTLCCPANVLGDLCREVETTWCQNGRCQQQQWQPVQQCPPPKIIHQQLPPPPQPVNPPLVPVQQPQPTGPNLAAQVAALQSELATLQKQCAACNCEQLRTELTAKIETLSQMQVVVNNDVKQLQAAQPETPNYDTIAAEVSKRLTHSATVTLLDGKKKTQTKPLGEPLEFIQHSRGLK